MYINVLNLAPHSTPADRLLKWKQPTRESVCGPDTTEYSYSTSLTFIPYSKRLVILQK